jgi:hypothetical protein
MKTICKLLLFLLISIKLAFLNATHFRGGSYSYTIVRENATHALVDMNINMAWRRDFYNPVCSQTTIDARTPPIGDPNQIVCSSGCGSVNQPLIDVNSMTSLNITTPCISFSSSDNWSMGEKDSLVWLPKDRVVELSMRGGDWVPLVNTGTGATSTTTNAKYELRMRLNLSRRNDTGKINESPITLVPPVIRVRVNVSQTIKLPVSDPDGDTVRCRWANSTLRECAGIEKQLKNVVQY